MYVNEKLPEIARIVSRCFPSYHGKKVRLDTLTLPKSVRSYWDGGSRDYFVFYELSSGKTLPVHSNHPFFEPQHPDTVTSLPPGVVIVEHSIFCGKDTGITIHARPEDLNPALLAPPAPDLSESEKTVLLYTGSLKNTYGGETDIRFKRAHRERGITRDLWDAAKELCITKGYLTKAGAMTNEGRNVASSIRGY